MVRIHWGMLFILAATFAFIAPPAQAATEFTTFHTITTDTVWTAENSPYILHDSIRVEVSENASLTIEPGVVVKFGDRTNLNSLGEFEVTGSASEPVIFTSLKDDTVGGDSNGDGNLTTPSEDDDWQVRVNSYLSPHYTSSNIENIEFRYSRGGLAILRADVNLRNASFASSSNGVDVISSQSAVLDRIYIDNVVMVGIEIIRSSSTIRNVSVKNSSGRSIIVGNGSAFIQNVEMFNIQSRQGIGIYDSNVELHDTVMHDMSVRNEAVGIFDSSVIINNFQGYDFDGYGIGMYGGNATITDSTMRDGSEIAIIVVRGFFEPNRLIMDNVHIENFKNGIYLTNGTTTITNSHIVNNLIGIETNGSSNITNSSFVGNKNGLINYDDSQQLVARQNWWGDASGPYHSAENPDGLGDEVVGNVDFGDWLLAPPGEEPEEAIDPLLVKYAPILYMHPQEDYFPMNVESFIKDSALWDQSGSDTQLKNAADLTVAEFESIVENEDTSDYYLAYSDPDESKSIDLLAGKQRYDAAVASGEATTTVYVHKMTDSYTDDFGNLHDFIVLQYWFFYAMNNWKEHEGRNNHEGDWESVFVFLNAKTKDPRYVAYSAHLNDGDQKGNVFQYESVKRNWSSTDVTKAKGRLVNFVSLGSHANYPDNGNDGVHKVDAANSDLTSLQGTHLDGLSLRKMDLGNEWLNFKGKWGADGILPGSDGPQGPVFIDVTGQVRFSEPIEWAGLDKVAELEVQEPTDEVSFPNQGIEMKFKEALEVGTKVSSALHDETISFGDNLSEIHFAPQFWEFETSMENGTFDVVVSLPYSVELLSAWEVNTEFVTVYLYDEVRELWEPVQSKIDAVQEKIIIETDHFSRYAVGAPKITEVGDGVVVTSHPDWYDQKTDTREMIVSLTSGSTLPERMRIVVTDISDPGIALVEADGETTSGYQYLDIETNGGQKYEKTLTFQLPTEIKANERANGKAKKPNALVKNFEFDLELLKFN